MIEKRLLPDGVAKVPAEARDHSVLTTLLETNASPSSNSPPSSWREVTHVVPGHGEYIVLRLPGSLEDYSGNTLDAFENAIVGNINGLKAHPEGWVEVEER
jgi:hypothetical protein